LFTGGSVGRSGFLENILGPTAISW
jgi:hypothetical protein